MPEEPITITELTTAQQLWLDQCREIAVDLFVRYPDGPEGSHSLPERMDRVYASWCTDTAADLPPLQSVYQGLSSLLGDHFIQYYPYRWTYISDEFGDEVGLSMSDPAPDIPIAILSPFSMVAKRVRDAKPFVVGLFWAILKQHQDDHYRQQPA